MTEAGNIEIFDRIPSPSAGKSARHQPRELFDDDNEARARVRVTDEKIRVLLVSGDSGWEFQYLRNRLLRNPHKYLVSIWQQNADLDFVQEFLVPRVSVFLRYLERDALLLDRVVGAVHIGKRAGSNAADDPVFPDFLSSSKQVWLRCRWPGVTVQSWFAIIGP